MSLPQTGITMSAVHCALAVITPLSSCTLSDLVKVRSINKWSACKPIQHTGDALADTYSGLTGVMATSNYGFDLDADYCADENACLTKAATSTTLWNYTKWVPSSDYPARLGDFRGYNHAAICPFSEVGFSYTPVPGVEGTSHVPTFGFDARISTDTNAEIKPKDMTRLKSGNYKIIYRKKGTNAAEVACTSALTATVIQTGRISGSTSNTGTFEVCLAIQRGGGDQEWYPMPETYRTFEVRNQTKEEYAGVFVTNLCQLNVNSTIGHLYVKLKVTNITDNDLEVAVGCTITDSKTGNQPLWNNTIPQSSLGATTYTLSAHTSMYVYGNENQEWVTTDPGDIRVEGIGTDWRAPIESTCYAKVVGKWDVAVSNYKMLYNPS